MAKEKTDRGKNKLNLKTGGQNALLSIFLSPFAGKLARGFAKRVPEDSFFRSLEFIGFLDGLSGFTAGAFEGEGLLGVIADVVADAGKVLADDLRGGQKAPEESRTVGGKLPKEVLQNLMRDYYKRMKFKEDDTALKGFAEHLKLEFKLMREIFEENPAAEQKKSTAYNPGEDWRRVKDFFATTTTTIGRGVDAGAGKVRPAVQNLNRLLEKRREARMSKS